MCVGKDAIRATESCVCPDEDNNTESVNWS